MAGEIIPRVASTQSPADRAQKGGRTRSSNPKPPAYSSRILAEADGIESVLPADEITDLIARTALGDRGAFSLLYVRTSAKLFGVCLRILKDRGIAEEALQEIYIKMVMDIVGD